MVDEGQLTLPPDFRGTYVIQFEGRTSAILGIQDGPTEIAAALNGMWLDGKARVSLSNPEDDKANIEFIGLLGNAPQELMTVTVKSFEPGAPTFTLDLETAELDAALRVASALDTTTRLLATTFELQLEYVNEDEDADDEEIPSRRMTMQLPLNLAREMVYSELEEVQSIDWQRPPSARDYVPFDPDQVVTGQQHYSATFGNGAATSFAFAHNLATEDLSGIEVRENASGGRVLGRTEYAIAVDSANQVTLTFSSAPASNALRLTLTRAGPASAFQNHTHTIGQITGLEDALSTLGTRVSNLELLLPSGALVRPADPEAVDEYEVPDAFILFPNARLPAGFDPATVESMDANQRRTFPSATLRPPGLLPAIRDASADDVTALPGSPSAGDVVKNNGSEAIDVPGGLGRRGTTLKAGEYAGYDGRAHRTVLMRVCKVRGWVRSAAIPPTDHSRETPLRDGSLTAARI